MAEQVGHPHTPAFTFSSIPRLMVVAEVPAGINHTVIYL